MPVISEEASEAEVASAAADSQEEASEAAAEVPGNGRKNNS